MAEEKARARKEVEARRLEEELRALKEEQRRATQDVEEMVRHGREKVDDMVRVRLAKEMARTREEAEARSLGEELRALQEEQLLNAPSTHAPFSLAQKARILLPV